MKHKIEEFVGINRVRENVDLFPYLSMRLHTKAQYFFEAKTAEDLLNAYVACEKNHIRFFILGGGSNAVFKNSFVEGLVVKNSYSNITIKSEEDGSLLVTVASGTPTSLVVQKTIEMGGAGFSYHKGLPGKLGGAVFMNSKWTKPFSFIGDNLVSATLIDKTGKLKKVDTSYFKFSLGYSALQETHEVLVDATFKLAKQDAGELSTQAEGALSYRKETQPMGVATCGCFFRNITEEEQRKHNLPYRSAGYLIDKAGLKGFSVGGFSVSDKHANFIVNTGAGEARPEDLMTLVQTIKEKVRGKFGVILKEEVELF